jgi:hypothetical protein
MREESVIPQADLPFAGSPLLHPDVLTLLNLCAEAFETPEIVHSHPPRATCNNACFASRLYKIGLVRTALEGIKSLNGEGPASSVQAIRNCLRELAEIDVALANGSLPPKEGEAKVETIRRLSDEVSRLTGEISRSRSEGFAAVQAARHTAQVDVATLQSALSALIQAVQDNDPSDSLLFAVVEAKQVLYGESERRA